MNKKLLIFSMLLMCMMFSLASANIYLTQVDSFTGAGTGNTWDGSIEYDRYNEEFLIMGANWPTGYIEKYNKTGSYIGQTVHPVADNYITASQDFYYTIAFNNLNPDTLKKYHKNSTLITSTSVSFENDMISLTNDNQYVYVTSESGNLYIYDLNLNYVGIVDLCIKVNDCGTGSLFNNLAYNYDENVFYYYSGESWFFYILDENFNDITDNDYLINLTQYFGGSGFRDMTYYDDNIIGVTFGGTGKTVRYFTLPPTPPPPNYHTILNAEEGKYYNYSKQYCVDSETYCNNSKYVLNFADEPQFYCSYGDSTFCSDGCNTLYNEDTNTFYGECTQLACENECNIDGLQTCTTLNTYAICGNYDSDACLEYSNDLFCSSNQNCVDTSIGAQCTDTTPEYGETYTQDSIVVRTDFEKATSDGQSVLPFSETVETVLDSFINRETVTNNYIETQIFKGIKSLFFKSEGEPDLNLNVVSDVLKTADFTPQQYSGYTCQYEEEYIIEDTFVHNDLVGNGWSSSYTIVDDNGVYYVDVNSSENLTKTLEETNSNLVFETIVKPTVTGDSNIYYISNEGVLQNIKIEYNSTAKTLIISETTYNKTLVNDTGLQAFDDLEYVYIQGTFNNDINTVFYEIQVNRKPQANIVTSYHYSLPLPYDNSYTQQPTSVTYESDNGLRVYQLGVKTISDLPAYTYTTEAQDFIQKCNYVELGCYELRTYGNSDSIPTYHFYDEYQICINELGILVPSEDEVIDYDMLEQVFKREFNNKEKLGISALIIIGIFFLVMTNRDGTNDGIVFTIAGVSSALAMIVLSLVGYLPIWITGLCIVIGAVVIKNMIQKSLQG